MLQLPRIGIFDASRCPDAKVKYFMLSELYATDTLSSVLEKVAEGVGLSVDKILIINHCSFEYRDASRPLKYYAADIEWSSYTVDNCADQHVGDDDSFHVTEYSLFLVLLRDKPINLAKKLKQGEI